MTSYRRIYCLRSTIAVRRARFPHWSSHAQYEEQDRISLINPTTGVSSYRAVGITDTTLIFLQSCLKHLDLYCHSRPHQAGCQKVVETSSSVRKLCNVQSVRVQMFRAPVYAGHYVARDVKTITRPCDRLQCRRPVGSGD